MNEIKLSGWLYSKKQVSNNLTNFSIKYYAGKDKQGNYINGFMNCKYFGVIPQNDKDKIEISGWLGFDTWEKDGKKQGRTVIMVKEINGAVETNPFDVQDNSIPF